MRGLEEIKKVNSSLEDAIWLIVSDARADTSVTDFTPTNVYVERIIAEFRSREHSR